MSGEQVDAEVVVTLQGYDGKLPDTLKDDNGKEYQLAQPINVTLQPWEWTILK